MNYIGTIIQILAYSQKNLKHDYEMVAPETLVLQKFTDKQVRKRQYLVE